MSWSVFKFGGASVKDAAAIENLIHVVKHYKTTPKLMVVVSAMGKTTNHLEEVWQFWINHKNKEALSAVEKIEKYHYAIVAELNASLNRFIDKTYIKILFTSLKTCINSPCQAMDKNQAYDQVVPFGELISTSLIHAYAKASELDNTWVDARTLIKTNDNHREAEVDWISSKMAVSNILMDTSNKSDIFITQGFIAGGTQQATTLGREGSDFTAGILAHCLNAQNVTIWKDVPGVLNADPKYFEDTTLLSRISFKEAIELSYYGATIIHPKTIKPLQNLGISLIVKSFLNPDKDGTTIQTTTADDTKIPSYIFKVNQRLISIQPRDFSFIVEKNLVDIFSQFSHAGVKIHLMENSALSFTVCVDENEKLAALIDSLKQNYVVRYNEGLELVTIRHYDQDTTTRLLKNKEVFLEQKSRETARFVVKKTLK